MSNSPPRISVSELKRNIKACILCEADLPFPPKPSFSFSATSKILIVGQAPGVKVQESGISWNDASGDRLREWLGVTKKQFYSTKNFAIVPMGFCYSGKGESGDLPRRPECAETWMAPILEKLPKRKITTSHWAICARLVLEVLEENNSDRNSKKLENLSARVFCFATPVTAQ
jgi:uracil-DNA glycosylase